ncbi:hypothetical protein SAMN05421803_108129 [Nocardiopsis flavescens]|uniref:Uncharacterized protein n=1 Tax=Nocardiopsis flavescens TaxID=758803 RepID=A0A1M6L9M0_9ACTN|nr:hypothetical protein SAMN05421803_108129 [Nocardiopsis flavescens]
MIGTIAVVLMCVSLSMMIVAGLIATLIKTR